MTAQPHDPIAQADFPAWEALQQTKHEFVAGHIYGFAGGTRAHSAISTALGGEVFASLRGTRCSVYGPDMLIEMENSTRYADLVVSCDERDAANAELVIHFPKLIVEVLSQSTAPYDLGAKKQEYVRIPSLEEYAVVDSRKRWAQVFRRDNQWAPETIEPQPANTFVLPLKSIAAALDLAQIYSAINL